VSRTKFMFIVALFVAFPHVTGKAELWQSCNGPSLILHTTTRVFVKFDSELTQNDKDNLLASIGRFVEILDTVPTLDGFIACSLATGNNYSGFLDSLDNANGIYLCEPYYVNADGLPRIVGERICVRFDPEISRAEIDSIARIYKVVIGSEITGQPNAFAVHNTDSSGYRVVDLANLLFDLPETEYSHPNFVAFLETNGYMLYDYYHSFQDHIKKVIGWFNDSTVWDFAGLTEPVIVAVLDDGVDVHEDLPEARLLAGQDYWDGGDPIPGPKRCHGQCCAGIIGASHSSDPEAALDPNSGMISLNPYVKILPVRIFGDDGEDVSDDDVADAIGWAWEVGGADILSNSWNYTLSHLPSFDPPDCVYSAIYQAIQGGRDIFWPDSLPRGCPVIFSAGNSGELESQRVLWPARMDITFAVGAVKLDDSIWDYSSYGLLGQVDVVAPSGETGMQGDVWSLDQTDTLGRNFLIGTGGSHPPDDFDCPSGSDDLDYICNFGGTSAAAPIVSGVASLLLARDPTLTRQEVYYILRNSAVTDLDWGGITPPDNQYGYGRVDAFRTILSIARGNVDNQNGIDIGDLTALIDYLFITHTKPFPSVLLGDCDCDGIVDISDLNYLIAHFFENGDPPEIPCFNYGD